jgi:hypothetical protein
VCAASVVCPLSFYILYFKVCCFNIIFIYYITTIFTYTYLLNGSVECIVTDLDIFLFANHLRMAAKQSRNM